MAEIGTLIDEKYQILKKIGQGGMSVVYLAQDIKYDKQWAVKEVKKFSDNINSEVVSQSLLAEAKLIKKLDHPALPNIVDVIEDGNIIYLVMDYIDGKPLNFILDEQGAQSQEKVISWAMQLCGVLNYLHNQKPPIIYRDMKPANIMLTVDGNIKLIDFGIAREYKEENIADTINLGTKGYAAPEQFGGNGQTDARTDIYCLGVTLYHLVTGMNPCEPPYEMYPIRHWNPDLSTGFEKIIQKCTQRNPEDRYQSCAEMKYALEHYKEVDCADKKKKMNIVRFASVMIIFCLFFGIVGFSNTFNNDITIYVFLLSALSFIVGLLFCFKFKVIKIISEFSPKKVKKTIQQELCNNETTLLSNEYETTLLSDETKFVENDDLLSEAAVLESNNSIEATSILDSTYEDTQILSDMPDNILTKSRNDSNIKNVDKVIRKKQDSQINIEGFEIIESITMINTKEEIA